MAISVAPVLMSHKNPTKRGEYRVCVRVSQCGKSYYIPTGLRATKEQFKDGKFTPKATNQKEKNQALQSLLVQAEKKILENKILGNEDTLTIFKKTRTAKNKKLTLLELVQKFIEHKKNTLSSSTMEGYITFCTQIKAHNADEYIERIDTAYIERLEHEVMAGLKHNTKVLRLSKMRAVYSWAIRQEIVTYDPFLKYSKPKLKNVERTFLTMEEIEALEALADVGTLDKPHLKFSLALFLFSVWSGFRFSDATKFDDSQLKGDHLVVATQKTGSMVYLPITDRLRKAIARLNSIAQVYGKENVNRWSNHIYVLKDITTFAKMAGIDRHISFHTARHTFGSICASKGIRPEITQRWMGHSDISTTMVYYHISGAEIQKEAAKFDD